jgi:DNA-binding NtrC family response regulator
MWELSRSTFLTPLRRHEWPGNVRELASIVKRWVVLGDERNVRAEIETRQAAVRRRRPAPTSAGLGLREIGRRAARGAEHAALQEALLRARAIERRRRATTRSATGLFFRK